MDGGAWWAPVHGVTKSWTRLSDFSLSLSLFLSLSFSLSLSLSFTSMARAPLQGHLDSWVRGKKVKHRIRLKFGVYEAGDWRMTSLLGHRGHGKSAISDSLWGSCLI